VAAMVISTTLETTVTGGPLLRAQSMVPGTGICTTAAPIYTGATSKRSTVSVFVA